MPTNAEQDLQFFNRRVERAYARCLRSFKEMKPQIIEEARRQFLLSSDEERGAAYDDLHLAQLRADAKKVVLHLIKMKQGWT